MNLEITLIIFFIYYHHTVQVARVQVQYLRQWVEGKHHWHKLQWVKLPRVQMESLCQRLREMHHHRKLVDKTTTTMQQSLQIA